MASKKTQLTGNNLLIVLLLVTLMVIGITTLVGKSLITTIVRDTKVVTAKSLAEKKLTEDLDNAPKLVDSYKSLGPYASVLADALPTKSDLPSLLVTLENMAAQAGLKLKSIAPSIVTAGSVPIVAAPAAGGDATAATPRVYNIDFTFDGTYVGLNKVLTAIELSARPMHVTSLTLRGTGSSLSGDVSVQTYFQDKAKLPIGSETIK